MASKITILTADNHDVIHGLVNFVALRGLAVVPDPSNPDNLIKAQGTKGHLLERDVVAEIPLDTFVFTPGLEVPVKVGLSATARRARQVEAEGADYIQLSGTGALDANSTAGTELGFNEGRYREKQAEDELAGVIRANLAADESDNTFKLLIEHNL